MSGHTAASPGIVAANYGKELDVLTPTGEIVTCGLARDVGDVPVAGDHVRFTRSDAGCYLVELGPRERLIRRAGRHPGDERILAAHIDLALVILAVKPPLKEGLVDRYLVALHHEGIEPVIVLNKKDLDDGSHWERVRSYGDLGYRVFQVCATSGDGVDSLRAELGNRTSVLVGHSGVGKSTLLMQLLPGTEIPVAEVSRYSGKGVHTTTTARLYPGRGDVRIIDSPGIRSFGLSGIAPIEVREHFIEFAALAAACRFRNCLHLKESGCAVREALEQGRVSGRRYASYGRIMASLGAG